MQQLDFEIIGEGTESEEIVVDVSEKKIRTLCQPYYEQIVDTKLLAERLYSFIESINPYFYELYLSVLNILADIHELRKDMQQWENILTFLKFKMITKRSKRIGQYESDWWLKSYSHDAGVMPKISKYRLPFLYLVQNPLENILGKTNEIV